MAMPSTGPVSFQSFKNEFRIGSGALAMSQMFRGGPYVKRQTLTYQNETTYGPWSGYAYQPFAGATKYGCFIFNDNGAKSSFVWNDVGVGVTGYFTGAKVTANGIQYEQGNTQTGSPSDYTAVANIRQRTVSTQQVAVYTNVNTSVPTGGAINWTQIRTARYYSNGV